MWWQHCPKLPPSGVGCFCPQILFYETEPWLAKLLPCQLCYPLGHPTHIFLGSNLLVLFSDYFKH